MLIMFDEEDIDLIVRPVTKDKVLAIFKELEGGESPRSNGCFIELFIHF